MDTTRVPTAEEMNQIKKQFLGIHTFFCIFLALWGLISLCVIPLAIKVIIDKESIPFAIVSILVQLCILAFALMLFKISLGLLGKIKDVSGSKVMVEDCTIHSVELRGSGRHTHTVVKVESSDGSKENVSTLRSGKVFKKGLRALLISYPSQYGKKEDKDVFLYPDAYVSQE